MEKNISKSAAMLAKEAQVKSLQQTLKKRKTTLKSLKTRLKNVKQEIKDVQSNTEQILFTKMAKLDSLRKEIVELAQKIKKNKHFSEEDRVALDQMTEEFTNEDIFGDELSEMQQRMEEGPADFDEESHAKMRDLFEEFRVEPDQEEKQDIREVYKKLSRKFHPDLAKNKKQEAEYHRLMQQINEAYKAHDVHTLLELEQLYLIEELDMTSVSITSDLLQQEIKRLERDIDSINSQIDRTSLEIKQIRKSEMGQMLTAVNKAEREGQGIAAMEAEFEMLIQQLEQIKEGLKDSLEKNTFSPILTQLIQSMSDPFGDDMFGDLEELFALYSEEEDYEENENPKFPIGTAVQPTQEFKHPDYPTVSMKGWQGWVDEAYIDDAGFPVYTFIIDSASMKSIPKEALKVSVLQGQDFQKIALFEHQLKLAVERETVDDSLITYRKLQAPIEWEMLVEGKELELIQRILLAHPEKDDAKNWELYLASCMPFEAKGKGKFELQRNKKVTVNQLFMFRPNIGFTASVSEGKRKSMFEYPLYDLEPLDRELKMVVELHNLWFEEVYDEGGDFF